MKKLLLASAIILSLCTLGGCSKDDDGPASGGKVSGYFMVDGKKVDLKYGYRVDEGDEIYYWFFDKDVMKYILQDGSLEEVDIEVSELLIVYDPTSGKVYDAAIGYKLNSFRETGTAYEPQHHGSAEKYVSFSENKGTVKCSSKAYPMRGYTYDHDEQDLGMFEATFSVEGKTTDISSVAYPDTRSISVTEITDPKQIAFLKSISFNKRKLSKHTIQ